LVEALVLENTIFVVIVPLFLLGTYFPIKVDSIGFYLKTLSFLG